MKKQLLTHLVLMLLAVHAWAQQSTTVTIGTGTVASATFGPLYIGNATGAHSSKFAAIYKASEINATPITARALTKIAWNKLDTVRYAKNNGVLKIYIKNTTASTIT